MKSRRILTGGLLLVVAGAALAASNPFRAQPGWGDIGRDWGSTSPVYTTPEGNVWVAERCGENTCVGHDDLDNVFLVAYGAELFGLGAKLVHEVGSRNTAVRESWVVLDFGCQAELTKRKRAQVTVFFGDRPFEDKRI